MGLVEVSFDGRVLDGSVHPFDLTVGPGMVDLGEAVLDAAQSRQGLCSPAKE